MSPRRSRLLARSLLAATIVGGQPSSRLFRLKPLAGEVGEHRAQTGNVAAGTAGLAQLLAEKGIRANTVAPGPIWTPLIPSTLPEDSVSNFGKQVPMKRPGQPVELATAYVMLADPLSSYVSGATIAVTGGKPIL